MPRREAERAVEAGRVSVDGVVVREPFAPISPSSRIAVDGREVHLRPELRALMFHKPAGVVTAGMDPEGKGTVFEALGSVLPEELRGFEWLAVGRLDRDTTGLLLFTNAPELVEHVTSPESHLPKRYVATVQGVATDDAVERLRQGVELEDGPTRPALASRRGPSIVELTITEGRHHQVKRMLEAVGHPVLELHREAVGSLELDVPLGASRMLSEEEVREALRFPPGAGR